MKWNEWEWKEWTKQCMMMSININMSNNEEVVSLQ